MLGALTLAVALVGQLLAFLAGCVVTHRLLRGNPPVPHLNPLRKARIAKAEDAAESPPPPVVRFPKVRT